MIKEIRHKKVIPTVCEILIISGGFRSESCHVVVAGLNPLPSSRPCLMGVRRWQKVVCAIEDDSSF
jgi:hypothetical protein